MIDDIHETFKNESELFDLLYNNDLKITFDFIELNDFGLTDDLYIKMNSREKLIEGFFEKKDFIEIAKKFEKEYVDIFWKYAKNNRENEEQDIAKLTDRYMYQFFYNLTLNLYAINKDADLRGNYTKLDDFIQENSLVAFFEKIYNGNEAIESKTF